jgi:hypothetical protein
MMPGIAFETWCLNNTMEKRNNKPENNEDLPGYKHYPENEDVFQQGMIEKDLDPESRKKKTSAEDTANEKDFKEDVSGSDLDIPGAELDDEMEEVGSEDEENNFYSLGGDDKESNEEDQGD